MPDESAQRLAEAIGLRLRELRIETGATQEQLAWASGVSKPYLSQIEAGLRLPSLAVLSALAAELGCELVDLVAIDGSGPAADLLRHARRGDEAEVRKAFKRLHQE